MQDSGFRIGRLFGINIKVNWSWLLILVLVTWQLASVFGRLHPGWQTGLRWGTALAAALLFFLSVLAHEMAHSLVAQTQGMSVQDITLFLFGGVSNIERHPPSPTAEFLIAIVGPVTSIVLGIFFVFVSGVNIGSIDTAVQDPSQVIKQLAPITTLLLWLGPINVMVGIFNLIPGFPLDGGRIVRSIFWALTNSLKQATRWASWLGQGIAWLMIVGGVSMVFGARIPFFGSGLTNGLWLTFIGFFLNGSAVQSYKQVVIRDVLQGVLVSEMMRADPPTVPPDCVIRDLVHEHIMGTDDHAFPVIENGRLVGLVTLDDVRSVSRGDWEKTRVRDVMTPADKLVVVSPPEEAAEALDKLSQSDVRQLPVMSDGELRGLLRRRDLIRWLQLESDAV